MTPICNAIHKEIDMRYHPKIDDLLSSAIFTRPFFTSIWLIMIGQIIITGCSPSKKNAHSEGSHFDIPSQLIDRYGNQSFTQQGDRFRKLVIGNQFLAVLIASKGPNDTDAIYVGAVSLQPKWTKVT